MSASLNKASAAVIPDGMASNNPQRLSRMPRNMGLREIRNSPLGTSGVLIKLSMPMRQGWPISLCAKAIGGSAIANMIALVTARDPFSRL